ACVLFTAAANVLPGPTIALLNAVVATSMLTTPLIMLAYQRFVVPRLEARAERATDAIRESNPVIVAGFGRFGQVVTRVLRGLGIAATVIDHDPAQIDTVRRFGWKAYYGDATRMEVGRGACRGRGKVELHAGSAGIGEDT